MIAVLLLTIGIALILIGLQMFFDPEKRKVISQMITAALLMFSGLYLMYGWKMMMNPSSNPGSGYYPT